VVLHEFISVKGIKAKGNQLTTETLNKISPLDSLAEPVTEVEVTKDNEVSVPAVADGPVIDAVSQANDAAESSSEESYDADDEAPQITLDF